MFDPTFRIPDTCCLYCGIGNGHQRGCPATIRDKQSREKALLYFNYGYTSAIRRSAETEKFPGGVNSSVVNSRAYQIGRSKGEYLQQMSRKQRELLNLMWEICEERSKTKRKTDRFSGPSPCVKASKG